MRIRKRMAPAVAIAMAALGMMVMATAANATHPRPEGASPFRASVVPAYNVCVAPPGGAPNRTHGPPLAFPSCNPPVQTSSSLTIGSPDANGAGANSIGFVGIEVVVGVPGPPEDSDVDIEVNITDVRCKAGVAACGAANAADGADYTGEIQAGASTRQTDHWNAVAPGGGPDAATLIDVPIPLIVHAPCVETVSITIGSTCAVTTTANTLVGGPDPYVKDGKRTSYEISQVQVIDGGTDGVVATTPNTRFGVQGIFIP